MKHNIKVIFFTVLFLLLAGCDMEIANPPEYQSQINKLFHFDQTYYVVKVKNHGLMSIGNNIYLCADVASPDSENTCAGLHKHNADEIVGIVDKNTTYRLDKVTINSNSVIFNYITMTTGPLTSTKTILYKTL